MSWALASALVVAWSSTLATAVPVRAESAAKPDVSQLGAADPAMRAAALDDVRQQIETLTAGAVVAVRGGAAVDTEDLRRLRVLRAAIEAEVLGGGELPGDEGQLALGAVADHALTVAAMTHFARTLDREPEAKDAELSRLLRRSQRTNRRWLGRPTTPPVAAFGFDLTVTPSAQLASEASPSPPVHYRITPTDFALLQARGVHADRIGHFRLPLDALFTHPAACRPVAEPSGWVRYRLPQTPSLRVAIGGPGEDRWAWPVSALTSARVRFDPRRALPLEEQLLDAQGQVRATVTYEHYREVGEDAWAPTRITIDAKSVQKGDGARHLRYVFTFQVESEVWLLAAATVFELAEDDAIERASSRVANLEIEARQIQRPPAMRPAAPATRRATSRGSRR